MTDTTDQDGPYLVKGNQSIETEGSLFRSAVERLESAAQDVDIDAEAVEQLGHPKTVVEVSVPLRRDDGSLRVFTGYRVRHDDTH